jgi:hypothetical protein
MKPLGFLLLTHDRPQQMLRLVRRLNVMYDDPPIVCHHDFGRCDPDVARFPGNVRFVRPHVPTEWGRFSVVRAILAGLRLLFAGPDAPEWFTLLSGADYPAARASRVLADLASSGVDAFLHHFPVDAAAPRDSWGRTAVNRYLRYEFNVYYLNRRLRPSWRPLSLPPWLSRPFLPFSRSFRCSAGWVWLSANARAVRALLDFHDSRPALARHYAGKWCVDESYFHCILCNDRSLKLVNDCKRYTVWDEGSAHPRTLGLADVPQVLASGCHFARKFDADRDSAALDALAAALDARPTNEAVTLPLPGAPRR